jgi:hypothetical protein
VKLTKVWDRIRVHCDLLHVPKYLSVGKCWLIKATGSKSERSSGSSLGKTLSSAAAIKRKRPSFPTSEREGEQDTKYAFCGESLFFPLFSRWIFSTCLHCKMSSMLHCLLHMRHRKCHHRPPGLPYHVLQELFTYLKEAH